MFQVHRPWLSAVMVDTVLHYKSTSGRIAYLHLMSTLKMRGTLHPRSWQGILLFTIASRSALGPTQLPIEWVPGALSPGCECDPLPPSSAEVKNTWSYTVTPSYIFIAWYLDKQRDNFIFMEQKYFGTVTEPINLVCRVILFRLLHWGQNLNVQFTLVKFRICLKRLNTDSVFLKLETLFSPVFHPWIHTSFSSL